MGKGKAIRGFGSAVQDRLAGIAAATAKPGEKHSAAGVKEGLGWGTATHQVHSFYPSSASAPRGPTRAPWESGKVGLAPWEIGEQGSLASNMPIAGRQKMFSAESAGQMGGGGHDLGPIPRGRSNTTQVANKAVQAGGASDAAGGIGMFARRAVMGGAIGAGTSLAWGLGPGDLSVGSVAGGAVGGAVLGGAGGYGGVRARRAGVFQNMKLRDLTRTHNGITRQVGLGPAGISVAQTGGPINLPKRSTLRTAGIGWGRLGMYSGAGAGGMMGAWAGNNMFGNSRRRKSMNTMNHYGEMF